MQNETVKLVNEYVSKGAVKTNDVLKLALAMLTDKQLDDLLDKIEIKFIKD